MLSIEIAYLERDPLTALDLAAGIGEFFDACGCHSAVRLVRGIDEVLSDAANGRIDVFACDIFFNTDDPLGLGLLAQVKEAYPSVFTVAVTGGFGAGMGELQHLERLPRKYDLFLPKLAINSRAFNETPNYKARLFENFRYSGVRTYSVANTIQEIHHFPPPPRSVTLDLLRQIVAYRPPVEEASLIVDVELQQLGGGRSASYVFELIAEMGSDRRSILPVAIKLSRKSNCMEELRRYEAYVKWSWPHSMRVDLLGSAICQDWGAIAYSFAHGQSKLRTLSDIISAGDKSLTVSCVERLFEGGRVFWQAMRKGTRYNNIMERYFERHHAKRWDWFVEDEKKMREFVRKSVSSVRSDNKEWFYLEQNFPAWPRFLQSGPAVSASSDDRMWSIVHGDLNANNVIISTRGDVALIDFRDTGIGHCFEDAIALECAVRILWPWKLGLVDKESEKAVLDAEAAAALSAFSGVDGDGWEIIVAVRDFARKLFTRQLEWDYWFGLSYYCFRLLRIAALSDQVKKRILVAGLHAAKMSMTRTK
jgi:hypothetical protein